MRRLASETPRPVPLNFPLALGEVEAKGSKRTSRCSAEIPTPESDTSKQTALEPSEFVALEILRQTRHFMRTGLVEAGWGILWKELHR